MGIFSTEESKPRTKIYKKSVHISNLILVVKDGKVYKKSVHISNLIAVVKDGGEESGAAAAVYLLLIK